jgi:hypothetical protein
MQPKKPRKKKVYRSPESRARQLAGLSGVRIEDHVMGVEIEKVNGKGQFASISEDKRKEVIDMYCKGMSCRAIEEATGIGRQTIDDIKRYALDHDSQFRSLMFKVNIRQKLQTLVENSTDRLTDLMPEMSAKDAGLALGISFDKLMALDRNSGPETLHQHVHLHAPSELNNAFLTAMQPKEMQE